NTLSNNDASGGSDSGDSGGSITIAGAVAVSVDTGDTKAFVQNRTVNAGTGAATGEAAPVGVGHVTAHGEFTSSGSTGVGVGVAIDVAIRNDLAYVTGTSNVTAGTLSIEAVPLDGINGEQSVFDAEATSGAGDASKVSFAGSLALNVTILNHKAYLDNG